MHAMAPWASLPPSASQRRTFGWTVRSNSLDSDLDSDLDPDVDATVLDAKSTVGAIGSNAPERVGARISLLPLARRRRSLSVFKRLACNLVGFGAGTGFFPMPASAGRITSASHLILNPVPFANNPANVGGGGYDFVLLRTAIGGSGGMPGGVARSVGTGSERRVPIGQVFGWKNSCVWVAVVRW